MEKIPTAKEMVDLWQKEVLQNMGTEKADPHSLENTMIDFAKLHVEAALKAAEYSTEEYDFSVEIKNSYPLENIK
jgi:hypothetical protein